MYPLGKPVAITDNYVETKHRTAVYVNGGDGAGYPFQWPDPGEIVADGVGIGEGGDQAHTPAAVGANHRLQVEHSASSCAHFRRWTGEAGAACVSVAAMPSVAVGAGTMKARSAA